MELLRKSHGIGLLGLVIVVSAMISSIAALLPTIQNQNQKPKPQVGQIKVIIIPRNPEEFKAPQKEGRIIVRGIKNEISSLFLFKKSGTASLVVSDLPKDTYSISIEASEVIVSSSDCFNGTCIVFYSVDDGLLGLPKSNGACERNENGEKTGSGRCVFKEGANECRDVGGKDVRCLISHGACETTEDQNSNTLFTGRCIFKKGADECTHVGDESYECMAGLSSGACQRDEDGQRTGKCIHVLGGDECNSPGQIDKDCGGTPVTNGACELTDGNRTGRCVFKEGANECISIGKDDVTCHRYGCELINNQKVCVRDGSGALCVDYLDCVNNGTQLACDDKNRCVLLESPVDKPCSIPNSSCDDPANFTAKNGACEIKNGRYTGRCISKIGADECGEVGEQDPDCLID